MRKRKRMRLKRIILVFAAMIIVAGSFAACSGKTDKETTAVNDSTATVDSTNEAGTNTSASETTAIKESTTEKVHKTTASTTKKNAATTAKKSTTTQKKVTTTKKKTTTAKKKNSTAKKKTTTTKKPTKNVTPSEICSQANAYIRSRGKNVDTSLRPNASSWRGQIGNRQSSMNSGTTLRLCKEYTDLAISEDAVRLYCYYDGNDFYILYMPF